MGASQIGNHVPRAARPPSGHGPVEARSAERGDGTRATRTHEPERPPAGAVDARDEATSNVDDMRREVNTRRHRRCNRQHRHTQLPPEIQKELEQFQEQLDGIFRPWLEQLDRTYSAYSSAEIMRQAAEASKHHEQSASRLRARGGGTGSGRTSHLGELRRTGVAGKYVSTGPVRERRIRANFPFPRD